MPPSSSSATRATIADVAARAGVSKSTVSRFLNRRDELLTPDIASRVESAVKALGYSPSPMAQALSRGHSRLIGLVVADVTNPFSVAVLRGAEKACKEAGYLLMLSNLGDGGVRERDAIEALASYQVAGLILNTMGRDEAAVSAAARSGRPVVLVDRRHPGMQADFVSLDNAGAVQMAAAHLLESGWRDLLYVTEPVAGVSSRRERAAAFRALANGRAGMKAHVFESTPDKPDALVAALTEHKGRGRRLAVLASNSVTTLRVAHAVAALGWEFGRDLGFAGIDETEWAPLVGPGLTTVAQPTDALGRLATACLLERMDGLDVPPRQILLNGQLVARRSSMRTAS
ncbi:LacI family DNA-binding transcriptional regulator [Caenimonas aquaedulcis]|nr:LacI family DNA-binding transcriptional regulator [Caenimonas aquaedulcis]